jgi:hypothetical protein
MARLKPTLKQWIDFICQLLAITWAGLETLFVMQPTWFSAYFNGIRTGSYTTVVDVNSLGEAFPELIGWCIATPIIVYGSILTLKMISESFWRNIKKENL